MLDINTSYETSASERDLHRICTVLRNAMEHRFEIVAIRIWHEPGGVVRVIRPQAGCTIAAATMGERSLMEGVHHRHIARLKCQVMAAGQHTLRHRAAVGGEQFVGPEDAAAPTAERNAKNVACAVTAHPQSRPILRRLRLSDADREAGTAGVHLTIATTASAAQVQRLPAVVDASVHIRTIETERR